MSESEDNDKNKNGNLTFIIFILNVIVLANTTKDDFMKVFIDNGENYYLYNQISTWGTLAFVIFTILFGCVIIAQSSDNSSTCAFIGSSILTLASIGLMITSLVFFGIFWYNDPQHTIPVYNKFWTEGATHFPTNQISVNSTFNRQLISSIQNNTNLRGGEVYSLINENIMNYTNTSVWPNHLSSQMTIAFHEFKHNNVFSRRLTETDIVHWPYVMNDVLIRISSFGVFILFIVLGLFILFSSCTYLCCNNSKKDSVDDVSNRQSFSTIS